jgi:hypothetical protein
MQQAPFSRHFELYRQTKKKEVIIQATAITVKKNKSHYYAMKKKKEIVLPNSGPNQSKRMKKNSAGPSQTQQTIQTNETKIPFTHPISPLALDPPNPNRSTKRVQKRLQSGKIPSCLGVVMRHEEEEEEDL